MDRQDNLNGGKDHNLLRETRRPAADVLCLGNLQLDVLYGPVSQLPRAGALVRVDGIHLSLSGNGGNVAAALGRLGVSADLAGYRGADPIGDVFLTTLSGLGVGTSTLLGHPSSGTGTSVIALAPNGERGVLFVNGVNALFDLDQVPDEWLADRRVVSLGSMFILPQFTGEAVGRLFVRARTHGAHTVLNAAWDMDGRGLDFLRPALAETDTFVLSIDEGRQLTGKIAPEAVFETMEHLTRGEVVMTLGGEGCCFREGSSLRRVPAVNVAAVDCTGAGDSFIAGYIVGLLRHLPPPARAELGCLVASHAVTGPGSYQRIPRLTELERTHGGLFDA